MDNTSRNRFESLLRGIENAVCFSIHSELINRTWKMLYELVQLDKITTEEYYNLRKEILKSTDLYWDKAKADFESAHKRIF